MDRNRHETAEFQSGGRVIDLTLSAPAVLAGGRIVRVEERRLDSQRGPYTGMIYHFAHDGMTGTYIDLPGHIKETDDGADAANYVLEKLYRVEATVIHLDRKSGSGAVSEAELAAGCPNPFRGGALILNALGARRFDDIEERSVWLGRDARGWILRQGIHLLVSDVYESREPEGVFLDLFEAGISTVCYPVNLNRLTAPRVKLTVLAARFETVTQLPCRVVAEVQ